jgi:hypothetical protein
MRRCQMIAVSVILVLALGPVAVHSQDAKPEESQSSLSGISQSASIHYTAARCSTRTLDIIEINKRSEPRNARNSEGS